ncbi:septum formation inhibitor-activating ATPase [Pseudoclavibacter sp. RFBJ3]|uniref:MinD/ParA family ATP-binding protein n=1 Tax=unclassified Pseudoclavibacter TaxID=2615177 RepID=UPI000CE83D58|nr:MULTISPECIES: P-loop NTPase [unclassified Pseudoclavibacter]PPF80794.1 septum formation inhibitor-activating ATPase [Pseudoclavibacter sp. RFBJ5]PPF94302.1 septum formation inhibitor-activating ATPase [Pseudoclavibacter sp. RFBJ3]PPF99409.1 septum formation inhibitor-activating ATPase [Pseudoclavibacter sp. RFBH5]PPG25603.1 septum formation inhibitor-activating ATPase [Pseudoclavibacter sp. RFBI4]
MARILMAIDFEIEARLLEGIIAAGHDIVDRVSGGLAAATAIERLRPEIVLLQGAPETLTARSLAACARFGARFIVVVASDLERRNAETLSAKETVEAAASWSEIEMLLVSAPDADGDVATGPIPQQSASFARPPAAVSRPADAGPVGASHGSGNAPVVEEGSRSATRRAGRVRAHAATRATREPGAAEAPRPARRGERGGRGALLAVWGSHGAPGASTVAAAVAASAAAAGRRVLLIDADSYGGSLAAMLGITDEAPGFAAACRLAGAARLTLAELERIAAPSAIGRDELLVLTGIANPARWPELSRERVLTVLERCREIADLVVVDVGFSLERDDEIASDAFSPRRSAATLTSLGAADRILAVADGQAVGLQRFLRARVNLIEIIGETPVDVIVNRVRGEAVGLGAAGQIKHVLSRFAGLQASALIPLDQSACDRALLAGEPVTYASPRSGFARAISSYVADSLLAEAEANAPAVDGVRLGKRTAGSAPFRRFWRGRGELQGQNS